MDGACWIEGGVFFSRRGKGFFFLKKKKTICLDMAVRYGKVVSAFWSA